MSTETDASCGQKAAKWVALVNDVVIPMPRQIVVARVIREQASLSEEVALVRDHDSPDDEVLTSDGNVDLSCGNVFYSELACDVEDRVGKECSAPAKLAFTVNDKPEVVIKGEQSVQALKDLFDLREQSELFRDFDSPNDQPLLPGTPVLFRDGPVLIAREHRKLEIIVNRKPFGTNDGVKHEMSGREIASLVSNTPDKTDVYKVTGGRKQVQLNEVIRIVDCEEFEVIRRNVSGGFNADRVALEMAKFRAGGGKLTLLSTPNAVIYHDVPAHGGSGVSDVLVLIPPGYPSVHLDGAFLPESSPYLSTALGAIQGGLFADGRNWKLKSYHPHRGGGGPPWDPLRYGVHTYYDELLCWLMKA